MGPLTILMGPNNSGKSYAATLIYSFLSSHAAARSGSLPSDPWQQRHAGLGGADLSPRMKKMMREDSFTVPATQANRLASTAFAPLWKDSIEHSFGSPASDLVRIGRKSSKITVAGPGVHKLTIADDARISVRFDDAAVHKVEISKKYPHGVSEGGEGSTRVLRMDEKIRTKSGLVARLMREFLLGSLKPQFGRPHYLPAARSGILQGHRALAAGLVQHATRLGIERPEIPRMTKAVSEFMSDMIDIPLRTGPFAALSEDLERGMLGGNIGLSQTDKHSAPDIVYKLADKDVPLHRSSSTVSELAPLSLYLKHVAQKGDLLIIEEPEAHLHISNQTSFAKYIARMIRQGLNLMITTHSFVLMEELNNYLIAGSMDPTSRRKAGIDEGDYLLHEEVSPHLCRKDGKGGHVIAPMKMDEYGISLEEFVEITDPAYERGIKMDEWVERNGS